ncbi:succinate-semialdehyde dehydrogenase/glutarate-semialdehyde dehydrogenase [Natronospira proteinivora]|uniref:Succinate-semialdehyde dehydrogenase/glutarate-semialdehyde dehydrogenase n=1 Tax=Natronospira proteinivora TaxID=1807133 RepID=A0ABT1GAG4_9GAMM|nr:NAD-dependent succinate-semialdehyde dehydrogenase [Natronospira proteinivora]MCP1728310.1 succinate-semialdehyde dehydrogenase/glutarate-semialdehyde dehydrogenase [Natronospira proteinivora]
MTIQSISPVTGQVMESVETMSHAQADVALARADEIGPAWAKKTIDQRTALLARLGDGLRAGKETFAALITREMGKCIGEARAEIEKCAWLCDYYADTAAGFLADETIPTGAQRSYIHYQPLGCVLGIMPWNFPFWQVIRFASPAVTAGNTALLKHAPNVPNCARALEKLFLDAGYPVGVFQNLPVDVDAVSKLIEDDRVHAVTLTGSERAGSAVARQAGAALKKTVLELGGSDPFIVLDDADLDAAVKAAVNARFQANGQSCIAGKRFILDQRVAERFTERFKAAVESLELGDPMDPATRLGPMARKDLRDELHAQVEDALDKGARKVTGCEPVDGPGWFYRPSILADIRPGMRAWEEELFGPVASLITVANDDEALEVANASPYGLGGSLWTRDLQRGERLARQLESGGAYINTITKSDPRTPFGGIKRSGYGRELSYLGLREFVNIKTIWLA